MQQLFWLPPVLNGLNFPIALQPCSILNKACPRLDKAPWESNAELIARIWFSSCNRYTIRQLLIALKLSAR
jgi:hypothetical protein